MAKRDYGAIDFDKYYGPREYQEVQKGLQKEKFTEEEKVSMLKDMLSYIKEKDYVVFHDFMDDICRSNSRWFNMLVFDRHMKTLILDYIKARAQNRVK